jgi:hypothetical protein
MLDSQQKPSEENSKKACQNFLHLINAQGNHTQPGKGVDSLVAIPLQTALHTEIQSTSQMLHEKEIRFTICLL